jgi:hypothetical protein
MRILYGVLLVLTMGCKERTSQPAPVERPPVTRSTPPPPPVQTCEPGKRTCVGDHVVPCTDAGSWGTKIESCAGRCRDGACVDTCALRDVELIYAVDNLSRLYSFDPRKLPGDPFHPVGKLQCGERQTLNSMAVDRSGVAWLGYHGGTVYRASIIDAHCSAAGAVPRGAPTQFGMGFASDGPDATTEKLFVAGGAGTKSLAVLDTSTFPLTWNAVAPFDQPEHPELTGTGDGRLFAYFPSPGLGFVVEIDRVTAKEIGERWVLEGTGSRVTAFAFAHWGGVFYVFFTAERVSSVQAVHMKSRKQERVVTGLPMIIVGAGVSTCAPLLEQVP